MEFDPKRIEKGVLRSHMRRVKKYIKSYTKINAEYATPYIKGERLRAIRIRMRMKRPEFARHMKMSLSLLESIEYGRRTCAMSFIELAEIKLGRFLTKELRQYPYLKLTKKASVDQLTLATELRAQVFKLSMSGMQANKIAQQLVLSPSTVRTLLDSVDES